MVIKRRWGLTLALILAVASAAPAADDTAVVLSATKLLEEISSNPESGIPPQFLRESRGIMIMPHIVETQLGVGRKQGHGVFLYRDDKGAWGNPVPVDVSAISVGAEAGHKVTEMVILYRTRKVAGEYPKQTVSLSLSLSLPYHAFRPKSHEHRFIGPAAESKAPGNILTYTRNRGRLLGATISGERKWAHPFTPAESKTPPSAGPTSAEANVNVTVKANRPDGSDPDPDHDAKARFVVDPLEVGRLKTVLTAMTATPAAPITDAGKLDQKIRLTNGAKPSDATTTSPR